MIGKPSHFVYGGAVRGGSQGGHGGILRKYMGRIRDPHTHKHTLGARDGSGNPTDPEDDLLSTTLQQLEPRSLEARGENCTVRLQGGETMVE